MIWLLFVSLGLLLALIVRRGKRVRRTRRLNRALFRFVAGTSTGALLAGSVAARAARR